MGLLRSSISSWFSLPLFFVVVNFYWSIVALQCCVSFCFTAKWISCVFIYVPAFLSFLPIYVAREQCVEFPDLYCSPHQSAFSCTVSACSCSVLFLRHFGPLPARLLCSRDFSGKNTGLSCHFLLQGMFSIQASKPHLLHCKQILDHGAIGKVIYVNYSLPFCPACPSPLSSHTLVLYICVSLSALQISSSDPLCRFHR